MLERPPYSNQSRYGSSSLTIDFNPMSVSQFIFFFSDYSTTLNMIIPTNNNGLFRGVNGRQTRQMLAHVLQIAQGGLELLHDRRQILLQLYLSLCCTDFCRDRFRGAGGGF